MSGPRYDLRHTPRSGTEQTGLRRASVLGRVKVPVRDGGEGDAVLPLRPESGQGPAREVPRSVPRRSDQEGGTDPRMPALSTHSRGVSPVSLSITTREDAPQPCSRYPCLRGSTQGPVLRSWSCFPSTTQWLAGLQLACSNVDLAEKRRVILTLLQGYPAQWSNDGA
jgi:hypothetical protein